MPVPLLILFRYDHYELVNNYCTLAFNIFLECLHGVRSSIETRIYPTFRITADDKYVMYASKHIFDEGRINPMFRELEVPDQKLYAEHQLYVLQKQSYNDMTTRYLQEWIQKAGRNATFDVLCKALDKYGFGKVSNKLLEMSREVG